MCGIMKEIEIKLFFKCFLIKSIPVQNFKLGKIYQRNVENIHGRFKLYLCQRADLVGSESVWRTFPYYRSRFIRPVYVSRITDSRTLEDTRSTLVSLFSVLGPSADTGGSNSIVQNFLSAPNLFLNSLSRLGCMNFFGRWVTLSTDFYSKAA